MIHCAPYSDHGRNNATALLSVNKAPILPITYRSLSVLCSSLTLELCNIVPSCGECLMPPPGFCAWSLSQKDRREEFTYADANGPPYLNFELLIEKSLAQLMMIRVTVSCSADRGPRSECPSILYVHFKADIPGACQDLFPMDCDSSRIDIDSFRNLGKYKRSSCDPGLQSLLYRVSASVLLPASFACVVLQGCARPSVCR
ncbi:hypothetical protein DER45DRAFT_388285 [Fusarium avenaceum]|nr:hypothetical protein DER45DRAFT_388285 [Fusarium avenaceum]